jgi:hypothetical protein
MGGRNFYYLIRRVKMKKICFVLGIVCMLLPLSGCAQLLAAGAIAAVRGTQQSVARSQAKSAHTKVVAKASKELLKVLPKDSKVWIYNRATGNETAIAAGIVDDLISTVLENGMTPVDRESAALIASERKIQLSGDVRDSDIMSIGNQIGAQYLVTINVIATNPGGAGIVRRAQMRVLNIETASLLYQSDTSNDWQLK